MRAILSFLLFLLAAGYTQVSGWYPQVDWLQTAGWCYALPLSAGILGLVLIAFSGRILRKDPVLFAWAVLGLSGSLLLIPLLVAKDRQLELDLAAEERLEEVKDQLRLALVRKREAEREAEADRRERARTDRFAQYEGRLPAATLDTLRAIDKEMQTAVREQADAYMQALEANPTKGPVSWMRFRTLEELEKELAAHQQLYTRTRAFTNFIETFEQRYTERINELELQPPADRVAIAELERILQSWERSKLYTLRQLDVEILSAAIQALTTLQEAWGTWSFNPREERMVFENPAQETAFFEAVQRMQAIAEELDSLQ